LKMYSVSHYMQKWNLGPNGEGYEFYTKFLPDYGCSKENVGYNKVSWVFNGKNSIMKKLHDEIIENNLGSRMNVKKLIEEGKFPESKIIAESFYMNSNAVKIQNLYSEMLDQLKKIGKNLIKSDNFVDNDYVSQIIEEEENKYDDNYKLEKLKQIDNKIDYLKKSNTEEKSNHLPLRQSYLQKIELLKLDTIKQLTLDHLESGNSVVIFLNFRDSVLELSKMLKTNCTIIGGSKNNDKNREDFLENRERIIICTSAGSTGIDLHDKYGKFPRISLISPNDSAQLLKQQLGRIWRSGGTNSIQYIVFSEGTIEEKVCENVKKKIDNINALNDGDLMEVFKI